MSLSLNFTLKIAAAAAVLAFAGAALPGGATPAEAKGLAFVKIGDGHHHRHWRSGIWYSGDYARTYSYRSCYWLKLRALDTGKKYWWDRYHACKGE